VISQGDLRGYIDNDADYSALSRDVRHKFLIQYGLPWYLSFYLAWKEVKDREWLVRCNCEAMVRDNFAFFARILQALGAEFDDGRLRRVLAGTKADHGRFQYGSCRPVGRRSVRKHQTPLWR
jgi:hypothetical protein